MTTALLIAVAAVALACPLHMLWAWRRGRRSCGDVLIRREQGAESLRRRQAALQERIAALEETDAGEAQAPVTDGR